MGGCKKSRGRSITILIKIDEQLLTKAKVEAETRGVTLTHTINEALREELGSTQG